MSEFTDIDGERCKTSRFHSKIKCGLRLSPSKLQTICYLAPKLISAKLSPETFPRFVKHSPCFWLVADFFHDQRSAHITTNSLSLHLELDEQIMPAPPAAHALAKDIHRQRQQSQEDGYATKHIQDLRWALFCNPIIRKVGESIEHEILYHRQSGGVQWGKGGFNVP